MMLAGAMLVPLREPHWKILRDIPSHYIHGVIKFGHLFKMVSARFFHSNIN